MSKVNKYKVRRPKSGIGKVIGHTGTCEGVTINGTMYKYDAIVELEQSFYDQFKQSFKPIKGK